jgi:hypothetical protein
MIPSVADCRSKSSARNLSSEAVQDLLAEFQ